MRLRPIMFIILSVIISVILRSPIPFYACCVLLLLFSAARDSVYGVHRVPYSENRLTDSLSKDGSVTNLRGIPYPQCMENQKHQGMVEPEDLSGLGSVGDPDQRPRVYVHGDKHINGRTP